MVRPLPSLPRFVGAVGGPLFAAPLSEIVVRHAADVAALDEQFRAFASSHLAGQAGVRYDDPLGVVLSALAPTSALLCVACAAILVATAPAQGRPSQLRRAGLPLAAHFLGLLPLVEGMLKPWGARLRPEPALGLPLHHHSAYSFPSGHTSSAAFTSGLFLFVLLPELVDRLRASAPSTQGQPERQPAGAGSADGILPLGAREALWLLWTAGTALGRVLTDSHWTSDTLSGALLGAAVLWCTTGLTQKLEAVVAPRDRDLKPTAPAARGVVPAPEEGRPGLDARLLNRRRTDAGL